jgi:hypothetical protein
MKRSVSPHGSHNQGSLNQLAAWAQEELAVQDRLLALMKAQEDALREGQTADVERTGRELEAELASGADRERRRLRLMRSAGSAFGLPSKALTLNAVIRRAAELGDDPSRLEGIRSELRERAVAVVMSGRRISALARYHQDFLGELLRAITAPHADDGEARNGVLVDAEA